MPDLLTANHKGHQQRKHTTLEKFHFEKCTLIHGYVRGINEISLLKKSSCLSTQKMDSGSQKVITTLINVLYLGEKQRMKGSGTQVCLTLFKY